MMEIGGLKMYNCWICKDRGFILVKTIKEGFRNDYSLHCTCSVGNKEKIDYTSEKGAHYYTEPISKYYDTSKIAEKNKKEYDNLKKVNKEQVRKQAEVLFENLY
jgi:hypothetical protein